MASPPSSAAAAAATQTTKKVPILSLPLVAPSSRLTNLLLADPLTPTPGSLLSVHDSSSSLLRRSRQVGEGSHFSYLTPLPLEFPYDLEPVEEANGGEIEPEPTAEDAAEEKKRFDKMSQEEKKEYQMKKAREGMEKIEKLMRPFELSPQAIQPGGDPEDTLQGYLPLARTKQSYPSARLLGVSQACLRDCLPHLDIGDAQEWIAARSGKDEVPDTFTSGPIATIPSKEDTESYARYQLSDYLSGRLIGAQLPDLKDVQIDQGAELGVAEARHQQIVRMQEAGKEAEDDLQRWTRRSEALQKRQQGQKKEWTGYAPWANAYSGHQFGVWAGQLGDGRATTLMETRNPETGERWEIQLKGAGRTPYSRFADGLATLASSVREYLASEALAALGVPTSRALSVISIKEVAVVRERRVSAAITSRLAPIWTRIGSFEHHADREEWESVRMLGEFVCREGYKWGSGDEMGEGKPWMERMVRECAVRNAKMVAAWQAVGFMHGVINTDNVSLLGITIDFGPYAFMDIFDFNQICNKSDGEGRYTYRMQPTMGLFAIEKLMSSVSPLIGFEKEKGRAAKPGELVQLSAEQIKSYQSAGQVAVWEEIKDLFMDTLIIEWKRLWLQRLAITSRKDDDRDTLIDPLLNLLEFCDFSSSLRRLTAITKQDLDSPEEFAKRWLDWSRIPTYAQSSKQRMAEDWLKTYTTRLKEERRSIEVIQADLRKSNPAFVLRNWVTDEVADRLTYKDDTDFLERVLQRCLHPYDEPSDEEDKRLCSIGTPLSGNMPSCSS